MSNATLTTPFWFDQRQCKAEEVAENYYRITGPNLRESYVGIRKAGDGAYQGFLRFEQDGDDAASTEPGYTTAYNAWEAVFELYREMVIV